MKDPMDELHPREGPEGGAPVRVEVFSVCGAAVRSTIYPPRTWSCFLSEAKKHSEFDPTDSAHGPEFARLAPIWECKGMRYGVSSARKMSL